MKEGHEQRLKELWLAVLSVDTVSDADDFFGCGGDSMAAIRLIAEICDAFDIAFDFQGFLKDPSFETLRGAVEQSLFAGGQDEAMDAHRAAMAKAEGAATQLLDHRPFSGDSPPKQSIAIAAATAPRSAAVNEIPHQALIKMLLETT